MTPADTAWRKSSRCASNACVEVARDGDGYLLRDPKNPGRQAIRFTQEGWEDFLSRIQYGDLSMM